MKDDNLTQSEIVHVQANETDIIVSQDLYINLPELDECIEILRFTAGQIFECMTFGNYDPRNRKMDHYEEALERSIVIHIDALSKILPKDLDFVSHEKLRQNLELAKDCLLAEWRARYMMTNA
jgi:DNA recombination-dependent growth factor C